MAQIKKRAKFQCCDDMPCYSGEEPLLSDSVSSRITAEYFIVSPQMWQTHRYEWFLTPLKLHGRFVIHAMRGGRIKHDSAMDRNLPR